MMITIKSFQATKESFVRTKRHFLDESAIIFHVLTQFIDQTTEEKWRANMALQRTFLPLLVTVVKIILAVTFSQS